MNNKDWQKAKEIFNDALEIPADRRPQFLLEKCGENITLREEVESLLENHTPSFLEDVPGESPKDTLLELLTDRLSVGQKIADRYAVLKKLGRGGMGEVYLAKDLKLDRLIALKILTQELSQDKHRLEQFEQEARAAAGIDSQHIVRIIEHAEADGFSYIITEFFEGENLRQKLQSSQLDTEKVLQIVRQVALALEALHEKNIVHSDIKPENIMINNKGHVKILDFGIAKLTEREFSNLENEPISTTQNGNTPPPGTANYMSPEQIRGKKIDGRSDIWSLGICLYEMLTSQKPFAKETTFEIHAAILYQSEPDLLGHNISPALRNIVEKALQKNREDRYQTIGEFRSALEDVIGGKVKEADGMNTFTEWLKTSGKSISLRFLFCVILCFVVSLGAAFYLSNLLNSTYSDRELSRAKEKRVEKKIEPSADEKTRAEQNIKIESGGEPSKEEIAVRAEKLSTEGVAYGRRIKAFADYFQTSASFFHLVLIGIAILYYRKNLGPSGFRDIKEDKEANGVLKSGITYSTGYKDVSDWKLARNIAQIALKDYRDVFLGLLAAWSVLYTILIVNFYNEDNYLIISLLTQANNFNTLCLWLCFSILNEPISIENKTPETGEIIIKSSFQGRLSLYLWILMGMFIWFVLEFSLAGILKDDATIIFKMSELISGLLGGIAMAVFVGRFQSKFLKSPEPLILLLYLYTVIQSLFLFFGENSIESKMWTAGVIQIALFLKCLLILYMFWLFQSGRLLFYLVRVRRADKQVDSEWENFSKVLKR